jgi:hypothetical protein
MSSSDENVNVPGYLVVLWLFLIAFIVFIIRHYAYRPDFPWHAVGFPFPHPPLTIPCSIQ